MDDRPSVGILCSGPCFAEFLKWRPFHDIFITINRTAEIFGAQYWVCGDGEPFDWITEMGSPSCVTWKGAHQRMNRPKERRQWLWLDDTKIGTRCPSEKNWMGQSLTCAMVFAEHLLRPSEVCIYGASWSGDQDWDGRTASVRHSDRWANEINCTGLVAGWLRSACGIETKRFINGRYESV